jgi:predicted phosphodiesterase
VDGPIYALPAAERFADQAQQRAEYAASGVLFLNGGNRYHKDLTRFALIADIHGNIRALDAVLADISGRGIDVIFDLGDSLQGPLDPETTADRLIERNIPSLIGNDDRAMLSQPLRSEHRAWIEALPPTREPAPDILLFHGTPDSDLAYLLEEVRPEGVRLRDSPSIRELLGESPHSLFACGHSHTPRTVQLDASRLIVNPGSVGLPAYRGENPYPHVMEAGSPHARYAVVTRSGAGWQVEHVCVLYDYAAASRTAASNGRPDWAQRLLAGRV